MKTLLLLSSSSFLENDFSKILGKPLKDYKIAHIITASKGKEITDFSYLDRTRDILNKQNCYFRDIDISGKTQVGLRSILKKFDGVFVNGGSSLHLLKCMRESGFNKLIRELLPHGFLYIGASAGSSVVGPSIEFNSHLPEGISKEELVGLKLVPFLIKSHYTDEKRLECIKKLQRIKYPVKFLRDGQGILVEDDKYTFVGDGEEVRL